MANRNPYVSTLLKRLKEQNNAQINERLARLGDEQTKDDIVPIFKEFNLELPQIRKKLTDDEKAERKQQREQKKAEKAEKEKQIIEERFAALKDVLKNGTDELKRELEDIIKKHQKSLILSLRLVELEEQKKKVEQLEKEIEKLKE